MVQSRHLYYDHLDAIIHDSAEYLVLVDVGTITTQRGACLVFATKTDCPFSLLIQLRIHIVRLDVLLDPLHEASAYDAVQYAMVE